MAVEIITKDDLTEFRFELIQDLKQILRMDHNLATKEWLKSSEVRKLLKISAGTLQTLRVNGTLGYTKIGGTLYYSSQDITKMLESNKSQGRKS